MIKRLLGIILILFLIIINDISAISLNEVKKYIGKDALLLCDIEAIQPYGIFGTIIETVKAKDGDEYVILSTHTSDYSELLFINIKTILKMKVWGRIYYDDIPQPVGGTREEEK